MHAVSNVARSTRLLFGSVAVSALALGWVAPAVADPVYLVGAQIYCAGEDGAKQDGAFRYSTDASTDHDFLLVVDSSGNSANRAISFSLSEGPTRSPSTSRRRHRASGTSA